MEGQCVSILNTYETQVPKNLFKVAIDASVKLLSGHRTLLQLHQASSSVPCFAQNFRSHHVYVLPQNLIDWGNDTTTTDKMTINKYEQYARKGARQMAWS